GSALRVAHFVEDGEDRIGFERLRMLERAQKRQAQFVTVDATAESALEQVVKILHTVVEPEHEADLLKAANRQPSTGWQGDIVPMQVLQDPRAEVQIRVVAL